jgi:hypothetical protein
MYHFVTNQYYNFSKFTFIIAMKVATGGKCRICKQFFTNMSHFVGESTDSSYMHQGDDEISPEDIEILEKRSAKAAGGTR